MTPQPSPARAHRARVLAAQAAAQSPAGGPVQGGEYELMLAQLVEHRRALKQLQSVERKIAAKRDFLPAYADWVAAALAHGQGARDDVLMTVLVWYIDVGDYPRALAIATYALAHGLTLPDQYDRKLPVVLIDELSVAALAGRMEPDAAVDVLRQVLDLTASHDAPDQARAKLHKALAYALMGRRGPVEVDVAELPRPLAAQAYQHCLRAFELFDQVGVKKDIERLDRRLKAPDPAPSPFRTPEPRRLGPTPPGGGHQPQATAPPESTRPITADLPLPLPQPQPQPLPAPLPPPLG